MSKCKIQTVYLTVQSRLFFSLSYKQIVHNFQSLNVIFKKLMMNMKGQVFTLNNEEKI